MPHILRTMLITILCTLPLASCGNADENRQSSNPSAATDGIMVDQRAPDFMLNDLNGKAFTLSELRDKKPVLLIFWATWCPACRQAMPYFSNLHAQYTPRGLEIISINIASNDPLPRVRSFQEINTLPYRILYDEKTDVSRLYAVFGIPTTMLIDRDGIIQYRGNALPANINQILNKLLAPAS
jgi:peroxiredoxin